MQGFYYDCERDEKESWEGSRRSSNCGANLTLSERSKRLSGRIPACHVLQGRFDKAMDESLSEDWLSEVTHVLPEWTSLSYYTCCVQSLARSSLWDMWPCTNLAVNLSTQQLGHLVICRSYSWRVL